MSLILNLFVAMVCFKIVFSIFGLLSIWLTARYVKHWCKDVDHKVLLNLSFILAINEIFGFANMFSTPEVYSKACLIVGLFRHFCYLSLYIWMLLLAIIELWSFVKGDLPKLKNSVCCILGYGLPLIPVTILTIIDPCLYTSAMYDRGFCYPERIYFWLSIQLPAGIVLILMVIVFATMLFHSFKCLYVFPGDQEKRKVATKRLITVLLIGLGWGFFFLIDGRIIKSDFLFDNLFLILCSANVFKLSLVFVLLDSETREGWKNRSGSIKKSEIRASFIKEIVLEKEMETEMSKSKN